MSLQWAGPICTYLTPERRFASTTSSHTPMGVSWLCSSTPNYLPLL